MTFKEFFSKDYLLDPIPNQETSLYVPLLMFFGALIVFAIVYLFLKKEEPRLLLRKYYFAFMTTGVLGLLYLFGRYEGLAWLGARITLLLIAILFTVWMIYNTIITALYVPKYKQIKTVSNRYEKYLPKPAYRAGRPKKK